MLNFCGCLLDLYRKWDRNSSMLNILNLKCDIWKSSHGKWMYGKRVEKNRRQVHPIVENVSSSGFLFGIPFGFLS